uniref:Methionyl-tRNA synthetase n=1 Tax=Rhizophora mucronata TaxID=61149 RepID=A0A2P2QV63_RHIMU
MCLVFVCDEDERVIARQPAPGTCPYCGGTVQAMDIESQWRFCFLPFYFKTKRKYYCSSCARRLVVQY